MPPRDDAAPLATSRVRLTREGRFWLAAAVLLALTGWLKGINLILLLAYLLIGVLVLNARLARFRGTPPRGQRILPDAIFAGEPTPWVVEVAAAARPGEGWLVEDAGDAHTLRWAFGPRRLRSEVRFPHRGDFRCEPLVVRGGYPFGLIERQVVIAPAETLTALPPLGRLDLDRLRHHLRHAARTDGGTRSRRRAAHGGEFHGLRQFRPGDAPHLIHWRTSARSGELMVREFDAAGATELIVAVDATAHANLDSTLSLATTLIWEAARRDNTPVTLAVLAADPWVDRCPGDAAAAVRVLRRLAREPGGPTADAATLADRWRRHARPTGQVIVLSPRPAAVADRIAAGLGRPVVALPLGPSDFYTPPSVATA